MARRSKDGFRDMKVSVVEILIMGFLVFLIVAMLVVDYRLHFVLIPEQDKKESKNLIHTP